MSCACWTKGQRDPVDLALERELEVLAVLGRERADRDVAGRVVEALAGLEQTRRPTTSVVRASALLDLMRRLRRPSSSSSSVPASATLKISGCGRRQPRSSPSSSSSPSRKMNSSPGTSGTPPSGREPTRSFGPLQVPRSLLWACSSPPRPCGSAAAPSRGARGLPWEKLSRNRSAPASTSWAIISLLSEAGPRVATIFVRW